MLTRAAPGERERVGAVLSSHFFVKILHSGSHKSPSYVQVQSRVAHPGGRTFCPGEVNIRDAFAPINRKSVFPMRRDRETVRVDLKASADRRCVPYATNMSPGFAGSTHWVCDGQQRHSMRLKVATYGKAVLSAYSCGYTQPLMTQNMKVRYIL